MRIEASNIPATPGAASALALDESLTSQLDGWRVLSHSVSQQLAGEMLLALFCER
jgi:hypothetical protein